MSSEVDWFQRLVVEDVMKVCGVYLWTTIFLKFLKFKCKISVQKEVIYHSFFFLNHILVTWPATNLLILRKWCGFGKLKSPLFCLRYDPLIVWTQNHITFIFIKMMSHDLLVQMAYCLFGFSTRKVLQRCRSLYVSGKLSIYPSPKPTLTLWSHLGKNVGLGEG